MGIQQHLKLQRSRFPTPLGSRTGCGLDYPTRVFIGFIRTLLQSLLSPTSLLALLSLTAIDKYKHVNKPSLVITINFLLPSEFHISEKFHSQELLEFRVWNSFNGGVVL